MKVLVVGGGIGGLAAAVALARDGCDVTVLEREGTPGEVGAGISLWTNALLALDELQLGHSVRASGSLLAGGGVRRPDGSWLSRSSGSELAERVGIELVVLHRNVLHATLRAALPAGCLVPATEVTGVEQEGDGVTVTTAAGTYRAQLVVGADGLRSRVRAAVWPEAAGPAYAGFTAWRGVTVDRFDLDEVGATWGRGAEFGVVPLPDGRVYWFGTANVPERTTYDDELAELRRRFGQWHAPIPALFDATRPQDVLRHDIYELPRPYPSFARGRVVLLGDAAHAMTPNAGQGACQALEDAVQLAACLRTHQVEEALQAYDAARRPRTTRVAANSAFTGRLIQRRHRSRDAMLRLVPQGAAMRGLARLIRWTPPSGPQVAG